MNMVNLMQDQVCEKKMNLEKVAKQAEIEKNKITCRDYELL